MVSKQDRVYKADNFNYDGSNGEITIWLIPQREEDQDREHLLKLSLETSRSLRDYLNKAIDDG